MRFKPGDIVEYRERGFLQERVLILDSGRRLDRDETETYEVLFLYDSSWPGVTLTKGEYNYYPTLDIDYMCVAQSDS